VHFGNLKCLYLLWQECIPFSNPWWRSRPQHRQVHFGPKWAVEVVKQARHRTKQDSFKMAELVKYTEEEATSIAIDLEVGRCILVEAHIADFGGHQRDY